LLETLAEFWAPSQREKIELSKRITAAQSRVRLYTRGDS